MKKIKIPNKEISKLFKFLEDNQIDEYLHTIKKEKDSDKIIHSENYDYILNIKKKRPAFEWGGTFLVGLFMALILEEHYEIIFAQLDWVISFIVIGLIGILYFAHQVFKLIISVAIHKNKFVRIDEDKTKKDYYNSNVE